MLEKLRRWLTLESDCKRSFLKDASLLFLVVLAELTFVGAALSGIAGPLDENDSNNIKHIMSLIATKSFALYAAEKASSKEKYLIEGVSKK